MDVAAVYTEAMAVSNDIDEVPERTIPQIRQTGLLALIRATLVAGGESHRLIEDCQSAGGKVTRDGADNDQAVLTFNSRWADGSPDLEEGADARSLYQTRWPTNFAADAYNAHFNMVVSTAGKVGQSPIEDNDVSVQLRKGWWHLIASPPVGSVYYQAAAEARTVTGQTSRTVADRNAFRIAMLRAITGMVEAGVVRESTGLAKGGAVNARYVEGRAAETGGM